MTTMVRAAVLIAVAGVLPLLGAEGLIQLIDPLDEPQFYCVDVPGFRSRVNLDAPLMAHTCEPGAADELFTPDHPGPVKCRGADSVWGRLRAASGRRRQSERSNGGRDAGQGAAIASRERIRR